MNPPIKLLAKNDEVELYRVQSSINPGEDYGVDIDKLEGTVFCDCPDFRYRKQTEKWGGARIDDHEHHCKHIRGVLEYE